MITTVIFDLGGVLLRTEDRGPRQHLAEEFGMTYQELEKLVYGSESAAQATLGRITAEEHQEIVLDQLGLPPDSFPDFADRFWGGDRMDHDLVDFIHSLKDEYTTALLSNAWDDLRYMLVERWKINKAFHYIFISAEMGLAKPDPGIYHQVIQALGKEPHEMVFLDDFIENVEAAREAGMHAVHFQDQEGALYELAEYLDLEI